MTISIGIHVSATGGGAPGLWPPQDIMWSGDSFAAGDGGDPPLRYLSDAFDFCDIELNGRSGETSSDILTSMNSSYTGFTDRIQVMQWGRNDTVAATVISNIDSWIAQLGHSRYVIVPVFHPASGENANLTAINAAIWSNYPNNSIPDDYIAGFSTLDLVGDNDSGDGDHPDTVGHGVIADAIDAFITAKGWAPAYPSNSLPATVDTKCLDLNGSDEYLQADTFAHATAHDLQADTSQARDTGWTVSAWVKTSVGGCVLRVGRDGPYQNYLYVSQSNGNVGFYTGGSSLITTGLNYKDGAWHHLVWRFKAYSATEMRGDVWSDGTERLADQAIGNGVHTQDGATWGARYNTSGTIGYYLNGRIFQPVIWHTALSDAEIGQVYNSGSPVAHASLPQASKIVHALDFQSAADGGTVSDLSASGWDFTGYNLEAGSFVSDAP